MCWDDNLLFIAFGNGVVSCYRVDTIEDNIDHNASATNGITTKCIDLRSTLVFSQKIHENTIQGIHTIKSIIL